MTTLTDGGVVLLPSPFFFSWQVLAMNLSAPFLVQFFGDQMSAALPYCDYVFGNESEAAAFGEKQGWGTDVATVALKLAGEIEDGNMLVCCSVFPSFGVILHLCHS